MAEENEVREEESVERLGARRKRRGGGFLGAVVLITIGTIFLLNNFGLLPWDIWADLWRLWPLILILVGLQIVFGGSRVANLLVALLSLLFFVYILVNAISTSNPDFKAQVQERAPWFPSNRMMTNPESKQEQTTIKEGDYQNVTSRRVRADVGTGKLTLGDSEARDYFDLTASYFTNFGKPRVKHSQINGVLDINFDTEGGFAFFWGGRGSTTYDISLGQPGLASDLDLHVGTGSATANLDQLKVGALAVDVGTGQATVTFNKTTLPTGSVNLEVGTGSIKVSLPKDIALKVKHDIGTGRLKIGESTISGDGTYVSDGYDAASSKLELTVDVGTGAITIERI